MKLFKWELSKKKFTAIVSAAILLLATGITLPIVIINNAKDKDKDNGHTHAPVKIEYLAPDCDRAGNNEYYTCNGCGKCFKDAECKTETTATAETLAATNHNYGEVSYVWNTDNTVCTATRICSKDETHVETETATVNSQQTKVPTCIEMGETTYTAAFTNTAFTVQTKTLTNIPIDSTNHKIGEIKYVWSNNNATCTATQYCERNTQHTISTENVTAEKQTTGNCGTGITHTYTATFTNTVFEQQVKTFTDASVEHTYEIPIVEWNEDYSDCTVTRRCTLSNHTDIMTKTVNTESDGAKTVTAYDENGRKVGSWVYKEKSTDGGYYLYQREYQPTPSSHIYVQTYDENGKVVSDTLRLVFEGYAPDSDDSEFGEP